MAWAGRRTAVTDPYAALRGACPYGATGRARTARFALIALRSSAQTTCRFGALLADQRYLVWGCQVAHHVHAKSMTARDEILAAIPALCARTGQDTFTVQDVVDELERRGSGFKASTIRTHIVSRMCANAPKHHARTYDDLERLAHGRYRIR